MKNSLHSKLKNSFTLAEVLITLGIIGVVAAMTIPSLIMTQQKQATATRLEKTFSILQQAFITAQNQSGQSQNWGQPASNWNDTDSYTWWSTYFLPYANLSATQICSTTQGNASQCRISGITYLDSTADSGLSFSCQFGGCYILNDGVYVHFSGVDNTSATILVDINGKASPNSYGRDIFKLSLNYPLGTLDMSGKGLSRTQLLSDNYYDCNKTSRPANYAKGSNCGYLIQIDGWKISDDYPW